MFMRSALASGLLVAAMVTIPQMATAAPAGPQTLAPELVDSSLVQRANWRHRQHCRYWHRECARRWGWHTRAFHRCLWRHGC